MKKLPVIAGVTTAVVAISVPVALAFADSADAATDDVERAASCSTGRLELSADRERSRFEVDADLDGVAAGSTWKVVLKHDGDRYWSRTLTADAEGELDVDTTRPNSSGDDVFVVRAKRVGSDARACRVSVTTR